ncbi:MAG: 3-phosphoshikimate 1-carboxyvinyltransferase [Thermoplasmata archaeon]
MTERILNPGRARGRVRAPASKSYTHRALTAAYLHGGPFRITRPLTSNDTLASRRGLQALGAHFRLRRDHWTLTRVGKDPERSHREVRIRCDESGTTLRFLVSVAARESQPVVFDGTGELPTRPMNGLLTALTGLGARVERPKGSRFLPLRVEGPIRGGAVRLDASTSSQFVSSLLLTLPTLATSSVLDLEGPIVSEPYIQATLALLRAQRIRIVRSSRRRFRIAGSQRYSGRAFVVPGDASSAAYLWVAAAITGGDVTVDGIPSDLPQADLAILRILRAAGARVTGSGDSVRVAGQHLRSFSAELTDAPDLYPLVGVLASATPSPSRLQGAPHIAYKESDRRSGTMRLARAMGATVRHVPGGLVIQGRFPPRPLRLTDLSDHRMVMSAAVAASAASAPSRIGDSRQVRKSFPEFWNVLQTLGIRSTERRS